ncbi:MAG: hypothetical protein JNM47_10760 [Hyphomonadaceae bacterium]|nr:hypothetical protein [Hyphomonadaceae bacterium]
MIRATIAAVIFCVGCSPAAQPSDEPEPTPAQQVSAESPATAYCEFSLGQPAPGELQPTATRTVPTEGDERVFADYQACEGRVPVTVELRGAAVWSIRIKGGGSCIEDSICVGDSYRQSTERFPAARQLLSREDGKTFSLLVRDGMTLIFPAESLADECYARPESCTEQIQQSRVEAIFLYDR